MPSLACKCLAPFLCPVPGVVFSVRAVSSDLSRVVMDAATHLPIQILATNKKEGNINIYPPSVRVCSWKLTYRGKFLSSSTPVCIQLNPTQIKPNQNADSEMP